MKASELRIGNWVKWNGPVDKEYARVSCIAKEEVGFYCGDGGAIEELEGVPLTAEILEKAGFEWKPDIFRWKHTCGWLLVKDNTGFYNGLGDGTFIQPPIKYLHQLQNLYHALTGEELTINLLEPAHTP